MQFQFCLGIPYPVLVILRIMASVKSEKSLPLDPVDIPGFAIDLILAEDHDRGFDLIRVERSGLPHKAFHQGGVVLCEHGGYRIPFR